jgi:hypothetical protein
LVAKDPGIWRRFCVERYSSGDSNELSPRHEVAEVHEELKGALCAQQARARVRNLQKAVGN